MTSTNSLTVLSEEIAFHMSVGLATSSYVTFWIEMKTPAQDWAETTATGLLGQVGGEDLGVGNSALELRLPLNMRSFDIRSRAQDMDDLTYTDWTERSYSDGAVVVPAVSVPNARTVSYKTARDALMERHGITNATAGIYAQVAQFITSAYRQCLEDWRWQEALIHDTVPVTDGLVTWADLQGADRYRFYTANPKAESTRCTAVPVETLSTCAEGVYIDSQGLNLTEVFVEFTRRPPVFKSTAVVGDANYGLGAVVYDDTSGHCFECVAENGAMGSDIDNGSLWRSLPLLWLLLEPVLNLAEAHFFSRSQERGQATSLRNVADADLTRLSKLQPLV